LFYSLTSVFPLVAIIIFFFWPRSTIILMKHFTTAITSFYWKVYTMPCFKHLRVSMSAFFFRRVIFLCSVPVCFLLPFILADTIIFFFWNHFCISEDNELLHHITEDKVFVILLYKHACSIRYTGIKFKIEVSKVCTKIIFMLLKTRKLFSLQ
jgi:hypothetical protein